MSDDSSGGLWFGGLLTALIVGAIGNLIAGIGAFGTTTTRGFVLIELIPAGFLALFALPFWKSSFAQGILTGAGVIAMIGGFCGVALSGAMH